MDILGSAVNRSQLELFITCKASGAIARMETAETVLCSISKFWEVVLARRKISYNVGTCNLANSISGFNACHGFSFQSINFAHGLSLRFWVVKALPFCQ